MRKSKITYVSFTALAFATQMVYAKTTDDRPNIIVVLVDDMGYSDLGCYGGDVQTPNIDKLAAEGVRFTSFYNCARSCPSRASLLTGLYPHQAGIGRMTFDEKQPGYRGTLSKQAVTIAEVLKQSGYQTGMVGKWHVAETPLRPDQRQWLGHQVSYDTFADPANYPVNRGFTDYYGIIYGVADYFDPFSLVEGNKPVASVPEDYYATDAFSDKAISYVEKYANANAPFFLYLSYTAPHWPLQAHPEDIEKYKDSYTSGWEAVRENRYQRMTEKGLFDPKTAPLSKRQFNDKWEDNPTAAWDARAMAVHAAMVDRIDQGIGRLLAKLKETKQLDNTIILFLSDNGCSPEDCQNYSPGDNDRPDMMRNGEPIIYPKQKKVFPGPENVFASIGSKWANVANTPFRFWKAKMYEGGICTPMIAHWPKGIKDKGSINRSTGHVIDIMATCLEAADAKYPENYDGNTILPLEGKSLLPVLKTGSRSAHDAIYFEHFGEKAVINHDGWKIVQEGGKNKVWELYNLNADRTETKELSTEYPQKVEELSRKYEAWAARAQVLPMP